MFGQTVERSCKSGDGIRIDLPRTEDVHRVVADMSNSLAYAANRHDLMRINNVW
jgi:hypothetical protein